MSNFIFKTLGFVLRTASDLRPKNLLKTFYCVIVRLILELGSIVWNLRNIYESYFLIESVQRRFFRFTCFYFVFYIHVTSMH